MCTVLFDDHIILPSRMHILPQLSENSVTLKKSRRDQFGDKSSGFSDPKLWNNYSH